MNELFEKIPGTWGECLAGLLIFKRLENPRTRQTPSGHHRSRSKGIIILNEQNT